MYDKFLDMTYILCKYLTIFCMFCENTFIGQVLYLAVTCILYKHVIYILAIT